MPNPMPQSAKKSCFCLASTSLTATLIMLLTGCQSTSITNQPRSALTPAQSQSLLNAAIKSTLYSSQDWVGEQQLFLQNPSNLTNTKTNTRLKAIETCQNSHDTALAAQLKADHLTRYSAVASLPADKKVPYNQIKHSFIACFKTADSLADSTNTTPANQDEHKAVANAAENTTEDAAEAKVDTEDENEPNNVDEGVAPAKTETTEGEKSDTAASSDTQTTAEDYAQQAVAVLGFKPGQVANFNNFFAKNGKIVYTGNYRPYQGKLAVQIDAGFENKNLHSHYRLPVVMDFFQRALYVKPDVIMPYTALYLDNKMGMSWQDKWYKFDKISGNALPASITAKAWLMAIKDSFAALPAEQFTQATPADIQQNLIPNLGNASQKLAQTAQSGQIIHWHETAAEQIAFNQAIITRYCHNVDNALATDSDFKKLSASEQQRLIEHWQTQKHDLETYSAKEATNANSPTQVTSPDSKIPAGEGSDSDNKVDNAKNDNADNLANVKPNKEKDKLLTSQPLGQDWYFVLSNGIMNPQLKQIYIDNVVTVLQKPAHLHTWVTFNPDATLLATELQPAHLATLSKTIRPDTILDGNAEIQRLVALPDSRRLFGREPPVITSYKAYLKKSKEKAKAKLNANVKNTDGSGKSNTDNSDNPNNSVALIPTDAIVPTDVATTKTPQHVPEKQKF